MLVIRRELPRTDNAGWARRAYRTKGMRVLLFVSPSIATRIAVLPSMQSLCSNSVFLELCFYLAANGPDKAQQFSSDGGDNLWLVFSLVREVFGNGGAIDFALSSRSL